MSSLKHGVNYVRYKKLVSESARQIGLTLNIEKVSIEDLGYMPIPSMLIRIFHDKRPIDILSDIKREYLKQKGML